MGPMIETILAEMDQEAQATRKVLERVPADKLGWKPHEKSMTLGALALHLAKIPGAMAGVMVNDSLEMGGFDMPTPASAAELLPAVKESITSARRIIGGFDDQKVMGNWKLTKNGKDLLVLPRITALRFLLLNHWYHHRGQMTVYLRMLNVPVPSIYGPSADENPFGA